MLKPTENAKGAPVMAGLIDKGLDSKNCRAWEEKKGKKGKNKNKNKKKPSLPVCCYPSPPSILALDTRYTSAGQLGPEKHAIITNNGKGYNAHGSSGPPTQPSPR